MVRVELTQHLFTFFPDLRGREIAVSADTVRDVLAEMEVIAPGFGFYICDERGRLRPHVNVFVNGDRVEDRGRLNDAVPEGAVVHIMQALSGG